MSLAPVRDTTPTANPLNLLGVATSLQRLRGQDIQIEQLRQRERQLILSEKTALMKSNKDLFDMINDNFNRANAQNLKGKKIRNQNHYGLNPEFYSDQIAGIGTVYDGALNKALTTVEGANTISGRNQAISELLKLKSDTDRLIRSNSEYQEALRNQTRYDNTLDGVDKLASSKEGVTVNIKKQLELDKKMQEHGAGERVMRSRDFNVDQYVFDYKKGTEQLEKGVETALGKIDFERYATQSPDGFVTLEKGEAQRAIDDASNLAYESLKNNHHVRGMADNLGIANSTSTEFELLKMIEAQLAVARNDLDNTITDLSAHKKPKTASVRDKKTPFKDEELNEIHSEISDQGFVPDKAGVRKIKARRKSVNDSGLGDITTEVSDNKLRYLENGEEIASFSSRLSKRVGEDGVEFVTGEGEVLEPIAIVPKSEDLLNELNLNVSFKEDDVSLSQKAWNVLSKLPEEFNVSDIVVTSTFRDSNENEKVGGVMNSAHKRGEAIDIRTTSDKGEEFAKWVTNTDDGKEWLNEVGYKALWEDRGGKNEHLHLGPINDSKPKKESPKWIFHD